jgi:septum formation protein
LKTILASASPRRQELFKYATESFEIIPADIDEAIPPNIPAESCAEYLAVQKAKAVAQEYSEAVVIGCDTVVICDGAIFGKPKDSDDARNMLRSLSGKSHRVATGVCLCIGQRLTSFSEVTKVEFYSLSDEEIDSYIQTGEPFDKAGAYGIQGYGAVLVKGIHGDFFNVMGLPVARLAREYNKFINV